MAGQTGRYLCSEETLLKVDGYLRSLIAGTALPGARLRDVLTKAALLENLESISCKQLLALMMNTRRPQMFAESGTYLDGSDWNLQENAIMGDIMLSTTGTHAFNNGAHGGQQDHTPPLEVNFLFVSSALLRNDHGNRTADMEDVLVDGHVDEEAFYKLYERRLLPGLLVQNEQAKRDNTPLVINIPGLGCGQFAGTYGVEVRAALPRVLKRLFETHGAELDMVHTVNYDPYVKPGRDEFTTQVSGTRIKLMTRPFQGLLPGTTGSVASQLEFPKDGTDYSGCRLLKLVAWDHFSFPGNDIWLNQADFGNGRATDDGVSFASSDVVLAMFAMGQFGTDSPATEIRYNPDQGIVYAVNPKDGQVDGQVLGYEDLAALYPSNVTADMIDIVPTLSLTAISQFERNKKKLQEQFINSLHTLETELEKCVAKNSISQTDGERLIDSLNESQERFFEVLPQISNRDEIRTEIAAFRKSCKENMEIADQIMGHGWLFRTIEVLIKAVVGLFAGIGMVLGVLAGQGLAKADHRHRFAGTFFALAQTEASQLLHQFDDEVDAEIELFSNENLQVR